MSFISQPSVKQAGSAVRCYVLEMTDEETPFLAEMLIKGQAAARFEKWSKFLDQAWWIFAFKELRVLKSMKQMANNNSMMCTRCYRS